MFARRVLFITMSKRLVTVFTLFAAVVALLVFVDRAKKSSCPRVSAERDDVRSVSKHLSLSTLRHVTLNDSLTTTFRLLEQLSKESNRRQEIHQQLVCNTQHQNGSTETGGWCFNTVLSEHLTDDRLALWLAILFTNQSVVGLGDGLGNYRRRILETGRVRLYDAFDGTPNISEITGGQVNFLDLTLPQFWLPEYDWVVCLEVAEHVPETYVDTLLDNIARLARRGVVLSWAQPGQPGFLHNINPRSDDFVQSAMLRRGFVRDDEDTDRLRRVAKFWWFRKNAYVYRRRVDT